jgi:hypothetical protein
MLFVEKPGLGADPSTVVVCVALSGIAEAARRIDAALVTVQSILADPDPPDAILIASSRNEIETLGERLDTRANDLVLGLEVPSPASAAVLLDAAARASDAADLLVIAAGTCVSVGWWRLLRSAAISDTTVASASPLLGEAYPAPGDLERSSLRIYPKIVTMGPCCTYMRRQALDLLGSFEASGSLGDSLNRAALRLTSMGMVHVAADDVAVLPPDSIVDAVSMETGRGENEAQAIIASDDHGALQRAIRRARCTAGGLSVTIDGRSLTSAVGGTQTYVLGLLLALADAEQLHLRVLVPPDLSDRAAAELQRRRIALISTDEAFAGIQRTDVAHRPQQVFGIDDFKLLKRLGERVVLTHQDLIAYHNYSYHQDLDAWRDHRRATQLGLGTADQVVFFSEHARRDALAEDLLPAERTHVVGIGAEQLESTTGVAAPPQLGSEQPFLLCIGADYAHKNRPFAIRLHAALRDLGWDGRLVFAGPHVPYGSSLEREQALLASDRSVAESVVDLGPVDEPTKLWLYRNACAYAYPTLYEGFGLLPLEAARWRKPCLFAPHASLAELAGAAATLQPWDASASALACLPLLRDGSEREEHLARLLALSAPTWDEVVQQLTVVYELAAAGMGPTVPGWQELDPEGYVGTERSLAYHRDLAQDYQDAYHDLQGRVQSGLPLIDDGGLLTPAQQRGLMRVASRRPLGRIVLGPFGLLGR